jgi:hypothetical protein
MFEDGLPDVLGIPGVDLDKEVIGTSKDECLPDGVSADLMLFCQPADGQTLNAGVSADYETPVDPAEQQRINEAIARIFGSS